MRRIRLPLNFLFPSNFQTLDSTLRRKFELLRTDHMIPQVQGAGASLQEESWAALDGNQNQFTPWHKTVGKSTQQACSRTENQCKSRQQNWDLDVQTKIERENLLGLSTRAGNSIQHRESETGRQSQQRANKSNRAGVGVHPRRRKTERENLTGAQNRISDGALSRRRAEQRAGNTHGINHHGKPETEERKTKTRSCTEDTGGWIDSGSRKQNWRSQQQKWTIERNQRPDLAPREAEDEQHQTKM
jgi:hypothetical protein